MTGTKRKQVVGLTGSIGSGKSTAAERLAQLGAHVIDADAISRALLEPEGGCFQQVVETFGDGILTPDGHIHRSALAALVFADQQEREKLNGIVHPAVRKAMMDQARAWTQAAPEMSVILDVPLLFECGMDRDVDTTLMIYASDPVRLQRILARDACTKEQASMRMAAQMSQEEKRRRADAVIDNNGSVEELYQRVDDWYAKLPWVETSLE